MGKAFGKIPTEIRRSAVSPELRSDNLDAATHTATRLPVHRYTRREIRNDATIPTEPSRSILRARVALTARGELATRRTQPRRPLVRETR